ncbi:hypothetical protein QVD17_11683 [Tagetes erecta]|uniref:Uncharacterized protein n=1 Tax=Tagetes erecta TaxID=13708 RepID=A0AAD8KVM1_TARER|nr:hypothetical protein QVD17_11683 [Tagetes erecta]
MLHVHNYGDPRTEVCGTLLLMGRNRRIKSASKYSRDFVQPLFVMLVDFQLYNYEMAKKCIYFTPQLNRMIVSN